MSSKQAITILPLSINASGAVTIYRGVGYGGAQATVAGQAVLGFANETGVDGKALLVNVLGTMLAEAGGSFNPGDPLTVDSSGRVVLAAALAAAAPVVDATKLAVASGSTPVASSAANGAIITAATGFLAAPVLSGGVPPSTVCGRALTASTGAGQVVEILRTAA